MRLLSHTVIWCMLAVVARGKWVANWSLGTVSQGTVTGIDGVRVADTAMEFDNAVWTSTVTGKDLVDGDTYATWMAWVDVQSCSAGTCHLIGDQDGLEMSYGSGYYICSAEGETVLYPATGTGWDLVSCSFTPYYYQTGVLSISVNLGPYYSKYTSRTISGSSNFVTVGDPDLTAYIDLPIIDNTDLDPYYNSTVWDEVCCENAGSMCVRSLRCYIRATNTPGATPAPPTPIPVTPAPVPLPPNTTAAPFVVKPTATPTTPAPPQDEPGFTFQPLTRQSDRYQVVSMAGTPLTVVPAHPQAHTTPAPDVGVPIDAPPPVSPPIADDDSSTSIAVRLTTIILVALVCLGCVYRVAPPIVSDPAENYLAGSSESTPGTPNPLNPLQSYPEA
eukprot:TRINITY_DN29438_c0_g1_i1.p1 TRINITY_DN29438_c0_g1~~TRINITY_DN29438_c0_g1_i1.p1  ORF type:complete len:389 (+),score=23.49 TRINITY_DN29438_c0_g1_i1:41-1207(+)